MYIATLDIYFHWLLRCVRSGKSLEGSAPILRVLFSFDVSDIFKGFYKVVSEFSQSIQHELLSILRSISSGTSALVAGSSSFLTIVWWCLFLGYLDHPRVIPDSLGFPKFSDELVCNFEQRPGKFYY